jgi:hypothetical protein
MASRAILGEVRPILHCTMCGTEEDADDFVAFAAHVFCRECRTCPHGKVHYETGAGDVCYECVLRLFTVEWFWGPAVTDIHEYVEFARHNGINPAELKTHTWEETEQIRRQPYWLIYDAQEPPPWLRVTRSAA